MSTATDEKVELNVDLTHEPTCDTDEISGKCPRTAQYRLYVLCPNCGMHTELECQHHKDEIDHMKNFAESLGGELVYTCRMCDAELNVRWEKL